MTAHIVTAGKERQLLCSDCVAQMFSDIGSTLSHLTVDRVTASDLALLKFPWCDACDASFAGLIAKKEVLA